MPVYNLEVDPEGAASFTMKYLRGMTLSQILQDLRSGAPDAARAYPRHRLLSAFSSLCLATPDDDMTGQGDMLGTIGYMSPEQCRGKNAELTPAADVYSLGAILFEILTLMPLHERSGKMAMIYETVHGVVADPSVRAPGCDVPPELGAVCVKATRAQPYRDPPLPDAPEPGRPARGAPAHRAARVAPAATVTRRDALELTYLSGSRLIVPGVLQREGGAVGRGDRGAPNSLDPGGSAFSSAPLPLLFVGSPRDGGWSLLPEGYCLQGRHPRAAPHPEPEAKTAFLSPERACRAAAVGMARPVPLRISMKSNDANPRPSHRLLGRAARTALLPLVLAGAVGGAGDDAAFSSGVLAVGGKPLTIVAGSKLFLVDCHLYVGDSATNAPVWTSETTCD